MIFSEDGVTGSSYFGESYQLPDGLLKDTDQTNKYLAGNDDFKIQSWEVNQLQK